GARGEIERDETGQIRVRRQREERARLVLEELEEFLFGHAARNARIVVRDLERKGLCVWIVALFYAPRDEDGARAAAPESAQHVERTDRAARQEPLGQRRRAQVDRGFLRRLAHARQAVEAESDLL